MVEGGDPPEWAPKEGDIIRLPGDGSDDLELECFFCDSLGDQCRFWGRPNPDGYPYEPGVSVIMLKDAGAFEVVDRIENRPRPVLPTKYRVDVMTKIDEPFKMRLRDSRGLFNRFAGPTFEAMTALAKTHGGSCRGYGFGYEFWFEDNKANAEAFAEAARQHEGVRDVKVSPKRPVWERPS